MPSTGLSPVDRTVNKKGNQNPHLQRLPVLSPGRHSGPGSLENEAQFLPQLNLQFRSQDRNANNLTIVSWVSAGLRRSAEYSKRWVAGWLWGLQCSAHSLLSGYSPHETPGPLNCREVSGTLLTNFQEAGISRVTYWSGSLTHCDYNTRPPNLVHPAGLSLCQVISLHSSFHPTELFLNVV